MFTGTLCVSSGSVHRYIAQANSVCIQVCCTFLVALYTGPWHIPGICTWVHCTSGSVHRYTAHFLALYTGTWHISSAVHCTSGSIHRYTAHFLWLCTWGHCTFLVSVHRYTALVALYTGTLHICIVCVQIHLTYLMTVHK